MLNQQTLSIAFNGYQIITRSKAPEVISGLERIFYTMVSTETSESNAEIEVRQENGAYQLLLGDHQDRIIEKSLEGILRHIEHEIATQFIRAHPDLIWLHAGAAAHKERAVLFVGEWGQGKSALVTILYQNGWGYLSDEIIPINPTSDNLLPFPQTPRVRKSPSSEISRNDLRDMEKDQVALNLDNVVRTALPISAIIFPAYNPLTNAELISCSPAKAVLELVQNCLNFTTHEAFAVAYFSGLAQRIPTFRLHYNNRKHAARLINQKHLDWHSNKVTL